MRPKTACNFKVATEYMFEIKLSNDIKSYYLSELFKMTMLKGFK